MFDPAEKSPQIRVVRDPVVVLAAGKGARMGCPKGLAEIEGVPLLLWQWRKLRAAGVKEAVLVLGFFYESYLPLIPILEKEGIALKVVKNPIPEKGPFSSIQEGLKACPGAAFILPVDVACPCPEVWRLFETVVGQSDSVENKFGQHDAVENKLVRYDAIIPVFGGRGGHPVWLSSRLIERLKSQSPESRLDEILRALPHSSTVRLPVSDPSVVTNWNVFSKPFGKQLRE